MRRQQLTSILLLSTVAVALAGCTSVEQQYSIRRSDLSCEDANLYAYRAMKHLAYEITDFEIANPGKAGIIRAKRQEGKRGEIGGKIDISCEPDEVSLVPHEQSGLFADLTFARGFYLAFTYLAEEGRRKAAVNSPEGKPIGRAKRGGLRFNIEPLPGLDAKLDFGQDLEAAGVLPVRITFFNDSEREYQVETDEIRLRPREQRQMVPALSLREAAKLLVKSVRAQEAAGGPPAPDSAEMISLLRRRLLSNSRLASGEKIEGFLFFPAGDYIRARALVTDIATSETAGFMVEF